VVFLLGAYHANGDFLRGNDAKPSVYLPVSVLTDGDLSFSPREAPFMFAWELQLGGRRGPVRVTSWSQDLGGETAESRFENGSLTVIEPFYYIVETERPDAYVPLWGPGAGLAALPFYAVARLFGFRLAEDPLLLWYIAKLVASLLVALSAMFLFLTAAAFTDTRRAAVIALVYGLGTCVWSVSSQSLWQHGPNVLFLSMGAFFALRPKPTLKRAALAGLAFALAVACRPIGLLVVVAVGMHLAFVSRKTVMAYVLGGLPVGALYCVYNAFYFGSPFRTGYSMGVARIAAAKTGDPNPWSGNFLEGFFGLLVSPSRGLLVYSPFLLLALWGMVRVFKERKLQSLRPLVVAFLAVLVLQSFWFDWYGGWAYGYRLLVDMSPFLCLFLLPVMRHMPAKENLTRAFALLVGVSLVVQLLGAFAYDPATWNNRQELVLELVDSSERVELEDPREARRLVESGEARLVERRGFDIDQREHRGRLWSFSDWQVLYYLTHFRWARAEKHRRIREWLANP